MLRVWMEFGGKRVLVYSVKASPLFPAMDAALLWSKASSYSAYFWVAGEVT